MTEYIIHPIVVGSKIFDKSMMTYQHGTGDEYTIPVYSWYLEGGDKTILVDTGLMNPIQSEGREQSLGGKIYTFEEGLARYGLTPEDVDIIIHTHLHNDHCENDELCKNAKIFVHKKELERIHDPHPLDYRYMEEYIEEVEEKGQIEIVSEDTEIVPGIRVMNTAVHTEGGLTVFVNTKEGTAAITGFCVIAENFAPPKELLALDMEVVPPGTHVNVYEAYDTMMTVRNAADIILPLHEPRFAAVDSIPES